MGQYWIAANLDKREYIYPMTGSKLLEHMATAGVVEAGGVGTGIALVVLCAAMPEARGGGDPDPNPYLGRWAGDRIVIIGDYAEDTDFETLKHDPPPSLLFKLCDDSEPVMVKDKSGRPHNPFTRIDTPEFFKYIYDEIGDRG